MTSHPSPRPVSALRARMIEDMRVRGFSEKTRNDYIRNVRAFAAFVSRSPAYLAPKSTDCHARSNPATAGSFRGGKRTHPSTGASVTSTGRLMPACSETSPMSSAT